MGVKDFLIWFFLDYNFIFALIPWVAFIGLNTIINKGKTAVAAILFIEILAVFGASAMLEWKISYQHISDCEEKFKVERCDLLAVPYYEPVERKG